MSEVALPSSKQVGRQTQGARQAERPGAVHAGLHLVDQQQIAEAFAVGVEEAEHAVRDCAARRRPPGSIRSARPPPLVVRAASRSAVRRRRRTDRRRARRRKADRCGPCRRGWPVPVRASSVLPPKPAFSARTRRLRELGGEGELERVLDGDRAADRGDHAFQAGPSRAIGPPLRPRNRRPIRGRRFRRHRWADCARARCTPRR